MQPTPLCGHKIAPILARSFDLKVISIYRCGAADAQGVGRTLPLLRHLNDIFHRLTDAP
jgi:hypothetical protein